VATEGGREKKREVASTASQHEAPLLPLFLSSMEGCQSEEESMKCDAANNVPSHLHSSFAISLPERERTATAAGASQLRFFAFTVVQSLVKRFVSLFGLIAINRERKKKQKKK
jgi:hypothetical protein